MNWGVLVGWVLVTALLVIAGQDLVDRLDEPEVKPTPDPIAEIVPEATTPGGPVGSGAGTQTQRLRPGAATTLQLSYAAGGLWLQDRRRGPDPNDALATRTAEVSGSIAASQDGTTAFIRGCCPAGDPLMRVELRRRPPRGVDTADWRGVSDLDLRLPSGGLAIAPSSNADALAVVTVPRGRYRIRVSVTAGVPEFVETILWPAAAARPLEVHKKVPS